MNIKKNDVKTLLPINQFNLYGYDKYFNFFVELIKRKKLPNNLLISGAKGLGKATFVYHLINYFLSKNEENKYQVNDFYINRKNRSYELLYKNLHPNFFLIENNLSEQNIKVDQIRNLLKFLSKSTYKQDYKIVLIDNAELLNLNSSNALLKVLEEHQYNTFFFIIHNSSHRISETIKSRCVEFKIFFSRKEKEKILLNLIEQLKINCDPYKKVNSLSFDTPGNMLNYLTTLNDENFDISESNLDTIQYLINKYILDKSTDTLNYISLFIEKFYNELCSKNSNSLGSYFYNYNKVLKLLNNMKRFNLNGKNTLITVSDILHNESK